jgi:hypothetical protein
MKPEQLAEVEELAALQFTVAEVAVVLDLPTAALSDGDGLRAFLRGRLKEQAEVRRSIVSMAKQGSSPAHKAFLELAAQSEPELDREEGAAP